MSEVQKVPVENLFKLNQEFSKEVQVLKVQVSVLESELKNILSEMKEIKTTNNLLLQFMYKTQGGKAWLFGLLFVATSIGALLSNAVNFLFSK